MNPNGFEYVMGIEVRDACLFIKMNNQKWYNIIEWLERQKRFHTKCEQLHVRKQYFAEYREVFKISRQFNFEIPTEFKIKADK